MVTGREQDYVYDLAAAVRALAPEAYDSHLFALEVRFFASSCPRFPSRMSGWDSIS